VASLFAISNSKRSFKIAGVLSLVALLAGCDDEGDSIGPKPAITLSGQVMKGALVGAPVNIYRANRSAGSINVSPNIEGAVDNLYTDSNGRYSVTLNGDSYRNRTLYIEVGNATCSTSSAEYVLANNGCTSADGSTVALDQEYFIGSYRCDDPDGCLDPTDDVTIINFGQLVPLDFKLRAVVPSVSNSNGVRSQVANVNLITTLAAEEIVTITRGYSENNALAFNDKISKVFQLDGIDILTQPMVDVSNLSSNVTDDNAWLLSAVNAGIISVSTRPDAGSPVSMGAGLESFITEYISTNSQQLVYQYAGGAAAEDMDLLSIYEKALEITADNDVVSYVSPDAEASLESKKTTIESQSVGSITNAQPSEDILAPIREQVANAKNYMFDYMDWYTEHVGPGTAADTKFTYMMSSARAGARESLGYMETLGNDFTLVLAASLNEILAASGDITMVTLNSTDKDGNPVTATLTQSGDSYTVQGNYQNTTFDLTFTYTDTTSSSLPANPPAGEDDDLVYRFDIQTDSSEANLEAENEGLTLNFNAGVSVAIQVDSAFDGTHSTVVRSSFSWGDITLAQKNIPAFDATTGRITIDGQLIFSMEHVADSITRFNSDYSATESFNVPRVDGREFVFLQFGIYDTTSPTPTKFQMTVANQGTNAGATWPVSFLYAIRNQENEQGVSYGPEGFGSFDQNYLSGTTANDWGETDCDFLPLTYAIAIGQNTSDSDTYNDIEVTLPNADGVERDLVYTVAYTQERFQLQSATRLLKDPARLCSVTFGEGANQTEVLSYKTQSVREFGSYMNRTLNNEGYGELSNTHLVLFSESISAEDEVAESRAASTIWNDCDNSGSYSGVGGSSVGRLYSCSVPTNGADGVSGTPAQKIDDDDDFYCLDNKNMYSDLTAATGSPVVGTKIERQTDSEGNTTFVEVDTNYRTCDDGEDWGLRYSDGTIQVLPVELDVFGVQSN